MNGMPDAQRVSMFRPLAAILLFAVVAVAGCSSSSDTTVTLRDNAFDPTTTTVDAGTEVHFEVASNANNPHTVTIHKAGDPTTMLLKDERVTAGEDVHFTFAAAGTYHVWCTIHGTMTSGMAMVVTVE